jgi:hypothetical protein
MNTLKLTGIVPAHCSAKAVGIKTEPEVTPEVLAEARKGIGQGSSLHIDLLEGVLVVSGSVWPPRDSMFKNTEELLASAYETVQQAKDREEANHKSLVDQYAQASGLPVVE